MDNNELVEALKPKQVFDDDFNSLSITKTFYHEIKDLMERLHYNTTPF